MRSNRIITKNEAFNNHSLRLNETLFCNANGYIGVRGTLEEGVPSSFSSMRGMYLGGVYETIPMKQAESLCNLIEKKQTMLNVADTQTITLSIDSEPFGLEIGTVHENKRILNMDEGYTLRQITWQSEEKKTFELLIKRMAHFDIPNLFTVEYSVKAVDSDADIVFSSFHKADVKNYSDPSDPRLAAESASYLEVVKTEAGDDFSLTETKTKVSGIQISVLSCNELDIAHNAHSKVLSEGNICTTLSAHLNKGETAVLVKYSVFADSLREEQPSDRAKEILSDVRKAPISELYKKQAEIMAKFWADADMEIDGDDELDLAMCFNMYQLFQSSPRVSRVSIAAKGLTGEGYEGHYFWDTEMYALPFFTLTDTNQARKILSFRYDTLDKARENALLVGHKKGALYPWRTITGEECSGYFPSGTAAYHINGAISNAVISYYLATGDLDFILDKGEEILIETSRLWLDTGNYDREGRFVINEVTGPDEYTCMTDNNFYTNCAAAYGMKWAVRLMRGLESTRKMQDLKKRLNITEEELSEILEASEKMYLPYDKELGITPQDDSFLQKPLWNLSATPAEHFPLLLNYHPLHLYRYQVCKQADTVLAHFLYPYSADRVTMEKSFRYYEKITTHDSSLSTCVFSMQASRLALHDEAEKYFGNSAKLDLYNLHKNSGDGVHTANMGGAYMAIVYGFGGVQIDENGLKVNPFLPKSFTGYSFNFGFMGNRLRLSVSSGRASLSLLDGENVSFDAAGETHTLDETGDVITWNLKR